MTSGLVLKQDAITGGRVPFEPLCRQRPHLCAVLIDGARRDAEDRRRGQYCEDRDHQEDRALRKHIADRARQRSQSRCFPPDRTPSSGRDAGRARTLGVTPRVSAATAGAKASPAIARTANATAIGQNVGRPKMMSEAKAIAEIDRTMTPRFAGVRSIAAPIGVWNAMPSSPLVVATSADFGLAPMTIRHQVDIDERPERVAGVRGKEIERVERIRDRDHRRSPKSGPISSPLTETPSVRSSFRRGRRSGPRPYRDFH